MSHKDTRISPKISRRAALSGSLAVIVAPAVARSKDPHPAWLETWRALRDAFDDVPDFGADNEALWVRYTAVEDQIAHTPAHTDAGLIAQLEWLYEDGHFEFVCDRHRHVLVCVLAQMKGGV